MFLKVRSAFFTSLLVCPCSTFSSVRTNTKDTEHTQRKNSRDQRERNLCNRYDFTGSQRHCMLVCVFVCSLACVDLVCICVQCALAILFLNMIMPIKSFEFECVCTHLCMWSTITLCCWTLHPPHRRMNVQFESCTKCIMYKIGMVLFDF